MPINLAQRKFLVLQMEYFGGKQCYFSSVNGEYENRDRAGELFNLQTTGHLEIIGAFLSIMGR